MSLRTRILLGVGTVLCLALLLLGFLGARSLYSSRLQDLGSELIGQWQRVESAAQLTQDFNLPSDLLDSLAAGSEVADARIYVRSSLTDASRPAWQSGVRRMPLYAKFRPFPSTLEQHGGWLMVSALSRSGRLVVQVGTPLTALNRTLELYVRDTVPLLVGIALIALIGLWLVTGSSLFPLERLTGRVARLDSPEPIPFTEQGDEVGKLARALEGSLSELRQTRESEREFLRVASHELRTPVAAMRAELELTLSRRGRSPESLESSLHKVYGGAQHLERLTQNLLTLGRVQGLPLARQPLDLLRLCGEVIDRMQPLAIRKDLDLTLEGSPCLLEGDPVLLTRVLENLLFNAIRFTDAGQITVRVEGGRITLEDSGPGFPPEMLEGFSSRPQGDLGIGLRVVREVVRAHGGSVLLHNLTGGSRVTLSFAGTPPPEGLAPTLNP